MKLSSIAFLLLFFTISAFSQNHTLNRPPKIDRYDFESNLLPRYDGVQGLDSVKRYDFTVTMGDGVIIDALKFIPVGVTPPAGGWPTVIMVHGYGDNKETLAGFCHDQAQYGYYTSTYSVRGQGKSGGLSNLISLTEAKDLITFVNFIKSDSVNGSNPSNILIMGGSQGGLLPYMAACNGLNVKTIISALAPPNFASSWIENGSIKMTFLWTITYNSDTARYTSLVTAMSSWVYANNKAKWDSLAYWLPVNRDFMNSVPNDHIPMIVEGSWQDKFFNAGGIIQGTTLLTNVPLFRMYIGAVQGHGGDHSPSEDQWHMNFFNDWFFYWLFGVQNGEKTAPRYEFASTTLPIVNNWYTFVHDSSNVWPPSGTTNLRFYFNTGNRLTSTAASSGSVYAQIANKVSGGLTMLQAVDDEFTGTDFNSKFKKSSIYFQTSPLSQNTRLTGTPKINMNYQSSCNTFCQYNFQIYEVTPSGTLNFINRINYTDRNYKANTKKTVNISGPAHSHIFQKGNRIRIVLTNLDTTPQDTSFLATNPFVLPVLVNGNNLLYLNGSSYIDLPVKLQNASPLTDNVIISGDAVRFSLNQNYPNPFNPSTVIEYSLPSSGNVKLIVYDIRGSQVKTLVSENEIAGAHSVIFDGTGLASGIYFYKLSEGSFQEIKKMMLVK